MMTDKSNFDEILLIENCLKLVRKYDWIVDSYIVDFYTEKIWETRVPESWRSSLNSAKPSDLANLLDYEEKTLTHDWPLELLALRESVRQLAVPRKPISKAYLQEILGVNSKRFRYWRILLYFSNFGPTTVSFVSFNFFVILHN